MILVGTDRWEARENAYARTRPHDKEHTRESVRVCVCEHV
jgi:hypothetical protein